jgi:uncharacterized protein YbjT (DUF2867 family)
MKKALIIGATGLVGSHCLRHLLCDSRYGQVTALTRKKLDINHPKLSNLIVNFDDQNSWEAFCAVDDVYSVMGTTIAKAGSKENFRKVDFAYPLAIAKAAKKFGAKGHALVSALGADAKSPIFYSKTKGELEQAITDLDFETNIILQPSLLIGERTEKRTAEKLSQLLFLKLEFLFVGPLVKYKGVRAEDVAQAMIYFLNSGIKGSLTVENKKIIETTNS